MPVDSYGDFEEKFRQYHSVQMIVVFMDDKLKQMYGQIKQLACHHGVLSQCITLSKVYEKSKNLVPLAKKLVLQMTRSSSSRTCLLIYTSIHKLL